MTKSGKILLGLGVAVVGYVAYRGVKAGGGAGGPIGVMKAGIAELTSQSPTGLKVIAPPNLTTMCGGKPCMGA